MSEHQTPGAAGHDPELPMPQNVVAPDTDIAHIAVNQDDPEDEPAYRRLKPTERDTILRLIAEGVTQREIAKIVGCTQGAISYTRNRFSTTVNHARALINARAGIVAQHWLKSVPIAARKGDHRPAKDWLAAAGVVAQDVAPVNPIIIQVGTGTSVSVDNNDPFAQAKVVTNEK
ncbi:Transposase IS30-like HTH domain containing protein [uncultured Caudovirales phage]|uniref:Transposase IS30-like HTH domain containing protein n=1 Tax=uncultured Caudovirales phage TaxID=2100421 RepID=A0A6J5MR59_9CAUD|nr:Transposase IS30-like HTH domain containing protein [uncultured Caudovirales phage]